MALRVCVIGMGPIGVTVARLVRGSSDFFVAGRRLGAPLVFTTVLASNIGAGATIGATGLGYREGLSAWWWSGSAAIGSVFLALFVGPRLWRIAAKHNLYTAGDYLELAGGPTRGADKSSMFMIRANGSVVSAMQTRSFWSAGNGFRDTIVQPGDTIFVPEELNKSTFIQDAKDWTQILYQFGLGLAGIHALGL